MPTALITGVTGQIGSYLAELLLEQGYEVHGIARVLKSSNDKTKEHLWRILDITDSITLHEGNIQDPSFLIDCVKSVEPDELYHLASIVEPRILFDKEQEILAINFEVAYNLLRILKEHSPKTKFFHAGSALMFGNADISPQNETTPFNPVTPYGIAKTAAHRFVRMYRDSYNLFACTGIFYNFESTRRNEFFLPRKITKAAARIKLGLDKQLRLGNIDARRDWGFAGDAATAAWRMLKAATPADYVIGTGQTHTVRDILDIAFGAVQLDWNNYVVKDKQFWRPLEPFVFVPDTTKIQKELDWRPQKTFEQLIREMVEHDLIIAKQKL